MGCNCGGSAPQAMQTQATQPRLPGRTVDRRTVVRPPQADRHAGGPGTAAYYWNGPARPER